MCLLLVIFNCVTVLSDRLVRPNVTVTQWTGQSMSLFGMIPGWSVTR